MNSEIQRLIDGGIIKLGKPKVVYEHIEVWVQGDTNDADYVDATHEYTVEKFIKKLDLYTEATKYVGKYIDEIEDDKIRDFVRDITPGLTDYESHTLDQLTFEYIDNLGVRTPFYLRSKEDARNFKIETIVS